MTTRPWGPLNAADVTTTALAVVTVPTVIAVGVGSGPKRHGRAPYRLVTWGRRWGIATAEGLPR